MAAANAMRTYLRDVIGIADMTVGAANQRRVAVQEEGLELIEDFLEFDEEGIKVLCNSVRKPGGTIQDPTDATRVIPNPGFSISAISERRMKQATYVARIYNLINRVIDHNTMSRERLRFYDEYKRMVEDHEDPERLPEVSKSFGIVKAMDLVPGHLRNRLGVRKIPLSYVIRDNVLPAPIEPQAVGSATGPTYSSIAEELIMCTPHTGDSYDEDNAKVYQILQDLVGGTSFESSIKSYQRTRDGRAAYLALCQHNLGSSKWDKIIEDAETYVMKREWNGRNYRFTLKSHVNKHREAHNEMVRASDYIQYDLPNEHTRVGRFIKSITSKEPAIISAITHIHGDNNLRNDFESAVDFMLLTAPNNGAAPDRTQRISAAKTDREKKKHGRGDKTGVELRYHTRKEYNKLSADEKKELSEWRKNKKEKEEGDSNIISSLQQTVKALEARIAALTSERVGQSEVEKIDPLSNPLNQRPGK